VLKCLWRVTALLRSGKCHAGDNVGGRKWAAVTYEATETHVGRKGIDTVTKREDTYKCSQWVLLKKLKTRRHESFCYGDVGANARCCLGGEKCGSLLTFTVSSAQKEEREAGCESGSERDSDMEVEICVG